MAAACQPPTYPHLLASIPPVPRSVPDTRKHGTPRSRRAPRPAARGPRARTPSRAGQTSTPSDSRRRRHPSQTPPRGLQDRRRQPPLPCWGGKEAALRAALGERFVATPAPRAPSNAAPRPRPAAHLLLLSSSGLEATREPIQTRCCRGAKRHFRDPRRQGRAVCARTRWPREGPTRAASAAVHANRVPPTESKLRLPPPLRRRKRAAGGDPASPAGRGAGRGFARPKATPPGLARTRGTGEREDRSQRLGGPRGMMARRRVAPGSARPGSWRLGAFPPRHADSGAGPSGVDAGEGVEGKGWERGSWGSPRGRRHCRPDPALPRPSRSRVGASVGQ